MSKGRLEAFSDGVIAILITIMVLELKPPHGTELISLRPLLPQFLSYVMSFVFIGIYWNNHHHLLQAVHKVNGRVLWANMHLLFWLSLLPATTAWLGETHFSAVPVAVYGVDLLFAGFAYFILTRALVAYCYNSDLARAVGSDWKGKISLVIYLIGIGISFWNAWLAYGLYTIVAVMWFIPDRRIEKVVSDC